MDINNLLVDLEKSKTQFHAVKNAAEILENSGFARIDESKKWKIKSGGKYFVTRNDSALIAFVVGKRDECNIVAAHTDSPVFKIKANAAMTVAGFCALNVESYGGGIYGTWYDRKLGIAGRLLVKDGDGIKQRLVDADITVVIPSLAVHMNRGVNEGVAINPQRDMCPVIGEGKITMEELFKDKAEGEILDYDLFLYIKESPYFFGVDDCLFAASRIDDLEGVYGGVYAIKDVKDCERTAVLALFDNEEVGSATKQGAGSTFLKDVIERINISLGGEREDYYRALSDSMMVSMDNAHGKHPNRPELNDPTNEVRLGGGVVIKHHANQNYTTDAVSSAVIKNIFEKSGVKYQDFFMRSDMRCGGTLGAISSRQLSIKSVDIGLAQWGMHSAVETASSKDFEQLVKGLNAFFNVSDLGLKN